MGSGALEKGFEIPPQQLEEGQLLAVSNTIPTQQTGDVPLVALTLGVNSHPQMNVTLVITGLLNPTPPLVKLPALVDRGADITAIPRMRWPRSWPFWPFLKSVQGVGGKEYGSRSKHPIMFSWVDNGLTMEAGCLSPYVLDIPIALIGRDILQMVGASLVIPDRPISRNKTRVFSSGR